MTTPDTPEDVPGQPDGDPYSGTDSSTGTASRRGFSWKNRWVLIGGGGAAVLAVVVIVAAVMLTAGGGSGGSSSALELIPDDAEFVFMLDLETIRDREAEFPGDYGDFADEVQDEIDSELDTEEISVEEVTAFVLSAESGYYDELLLIQGNFFFEDIRDDWEDQGYEEDSYLGYEIWNGDDHYALLEDAGAIVGSEDEDRIKDVIKMLDRGSDSLATAEGNDLAAILDQLGASPVVFAMSGETAESCEDDVSGCVGFGAAFAGVDLDREEVSANLVFLFSSERRAQRAVDDYDDVADLMEETLESLAGAADNFSGMPDADGVDIDEVAAEGEFVLGTGFIEIELD